MIVSDVFHINCVPNEISNIIKVCGGEPVEGCGGVSCWKVDYAADAIKREAASTSDILLKLTRIAQQLDVYEISFTMRDPPPPPPPPPPKKKKKKQLIYLSKSPPKKKKKKKTPVNEVNSDQNMLFTPPPGMTTHW